MIKKVTIIILLFSLTLGGAAPALALMQSDAGCEMACCLSQEHQDRSRKAPVSQNSRMMDDCQIQPCSSPEAPDQLDIQADLPTLKQSALNLTAVATGIPVTQNSDRNTSFHNQFITSRHLLTGREILTTVSILII